MLTPKFFLKTQRLGFRTWTKDDLHHAIGLWGDFEVTKLFDGRGPLSNDQVQGRLLEEMASQAAHGIQYWPIFLLKTGEHVGCAGLRPYELAEKILEIGLHIRSKCWRRGYAYEAALGVFAYAFDTLSLAELFAGHNPKNQASKNLLIKLGFRYTHDEYYKPTGLQHPSYRLTAKEYTQMYKIRGQRRYYEFISE